MSEQFSDKLGYLHSVCSGLGKVVYVSEWRSVIPVTLNVGDGVRLINRQNCTCARKTEFTLDRRRAPGVGGHGDVPLSHLKNVVTATRIVNRD